MANTQYMLTTIDNPYDPSTQFDEWFNFDTQKGYNSCAYLARVAKLNSTMTDIEQTLETELAIDQIVKFDPLGIYIKVESKKQSTNEVEEDEES